ncbi:MAG: formiminotetrahydrofolate cyclodeaminase [Cellvibrionaceae bacterium]|jgi:formiminotetrahydrofolate cyclodeaminase
MQELDQFIIHLAEPTPAPGGGGAAGLAGSLAAALAQMVAGLTVTRRKYAEHHPEVNELLRKTEQLRGELVKSVEDDAHVYKRVITVLSYQTDKNDKSVTQALEDALVGAAQVPLTVTQLCGEVATIAERLVEIGLNHAAADAAAAIFLAQAAARISLLNIKANMREVNDLKLKTSWVNKATRIVNQINASAERVELKLSEELSKPQATARKRRRKE